MIYDLGVVKDNTADNIRLFDFLICIQTGEKKSDTYMKEDVFHCLDQISPSYEICCLKYDLS